MMELNDMNSQDDKNTAPVSKTPPSSQPNSGSNKYIVGVVGVIALLALLVSVAALVLTLVMSQQLNQSLREEVAALKEQLSTLTDPTMPPTTSPPTTPPSPCTPELGSRDNPINSCGDIPQECPSGDYWVNSSPPVQVYCDTNRRNCSCNSTGGWMRVANLDLTDPNQTCPANLNQQERNEPPLRTCGRPLPYAPVCTPINFPTHGVEYSRVCGRVIGYQFSFPSAFIAYFRDRGITIDDSYVDGFSLTHGQSPRQHVWTFAAAIEEQGQIDSICPCTRAEQNFTGAVPPFIGQDYFCATAAMPFSGDDIFFGDNPLWDGRGCGDIGTCCEFNNPPWFCKQLPQPTTDDIELRICSSTDRSYSDTPLEIAEVYVQ